MSLNPLLTHSGKQRMWLPYFSTQQLNASTISTGTLTASLVSTNQLIAGDAQISTLETDYISTNLLFADAGTISTFSTFEIVLDSQTLNANATELLLNGIPVATTANLSSIADWSYDPAVSTVQMQGNDLNAAGTVSSVTVRAGNAMFQNLIAINALFVSTATSTLSTSINVADLGLYSTINTNNLVASTLAAETATISSMTANSVGIQYLTLSSMTASEYVSTPSLIVSSINGSEFTSTGITVQVAGVSSLVANSISSIGAEIRQALVSSIVFNPSLNPSLGGVNVNLGLGSILGNVIGWGAGVFGAAAGTVGLATGIAALAMGRQQDFIDNSRYELINGTTQLQFSTLGTTVSSIQRLSDSASPDQIPGSTIYISTILPPGTLALRSVSDPINTVSTPNSTIQAFGPWVAVPPELTTSSFAEIYTSSLQASSIQTLDAAVSSVVGLSSINGKSIAQYENLSSFEWAEYPAISTISFSTSVSAIIQSGTPSTDNIALVGSNIQLVGAYTDAKNLLLASTISTAVVLGANDNLFGVGGIRGLKLDAPNLFFSTTQTNITGLINASTIDSFATNSRFATASTVTTSSLTLTQTGAYGLSSLMYLSTSIIPGTGTSTTTYLNTDLSLMGNDIYAQQLRVGYGQGGSGATTEILMFPPNNTEVKGLNVANADRTIRLISTANTGAGGYLLDTTINPPLFSTINNQVNLVSYFPSTNSASIGYSSITKMNPVTLYGRSTLAGGTVNVVFSPPYADSNEYSVNLTYRTTAGGAPLHANILSVSSFSANGSATNDFFWQTIGRV